MTGAARLAARAAQRIGAGLVTVLSPPESFPVYASALTSVLVEPVEGEKEYTAAVSDSRRNAILVGPGAGVSEMTRQQTLAALHTGKPCVLDADALTVFAENPDRLQEVLHRRCLLTPHDGEYARLFHFVGDRLSRSRLAAAACGAVVLVKGGDTAVAAPDGRAVLTSNAPPDLATAGAGDVLAGFALGLLAQGMDVWPAAAAATWLHAEAAARFGLGLIAEDLSEQLPALLREVVEEL
jgi:NAD(P)H-hydrate epimerase